MRAFGLLGLIFAMGIGLFVYKQQIQSTSSVAGATANPRVTVDVMGVRNDLIAIANAERRRFATDNKYVSIGDLISNGDISMPAPSRGPYSYTADVSENAFTITATYSGPDGSVPKTLSIDQTMQMKTE
jgi:hypothetical protein